MESVLVIAASDKRQTVKLAAPTTHANVTAGAQMRAVLAHTTLNVRLVVPTLLLWVDTAPAMKATEDHAARTTLENVTVVVMVVTAQVVSTASAVACTLIVILLAELASATMTSLRTAPDAALFVKSHVHQAV